MHSEHLAPPRFQHSFCRTLASSVQPVFKILDLHGVCHLGVSDRDGHGGQSSFDFVYQVVVGKDSEGLGDSFVEGLCHYVERVRRLIQIVDNDRARSERHACNLAYSPIVRPLV
jgi:hypothetical protein